MKNLLENHFFPFVVKPGRYAGNEPGQIVKDPGGRVKYLHAFPDKYELGQSYLGLQTLYHIINGDDRFLCERAFAVDTDAEELMRRHNIPLFSLESYRPAGEFDAVGFTLTYELVYTNVLQMLDLAGIPLRSKDRTSKDPLIMAGGPAAYNPDPMAPFMDLFFIGDAEEGLPEMLAILHEMADAPREEKLKEICRRVESVYIPAFYDNSKSPRFDFVPQLVKARVMPELKPSFYPDQPIVPLVDTAHRHLSVEIMRGCPQGCRFCQAGPIYRPVRLRKKDDIMRQADTQLKNTGFEEVTLLSLSSSDFPGIDQLAADLSRRLESQKVSVSLPSLRPDTISGRLLDSVSRIRKAGLTISPEAGTERLRLFIRKDFPDRAIYDTARLAFSKGWTTIKLYFMIGIPTETDEDLLGIVNIISTVNDIGREYPGKKTINVTLSPFVPKPHTPLQWDGMGSQEEIFDKIRFIKRHNRVNQVNFKYPLTESSVLQGVLGRAGKEVSEAILTAYRNGCRFDGWNEAFDFSRWQKAFDEAGLSVEAILKPIPFGADLPWSHVTKGVSVEQLAKERHRTSVQMRDYVPPPEDVENDNTDGQHVSYGRGKRKQPSRNVIAPTKNRVRLRWGKDERYRFMSHLENLRLLERTLRKARVPVSYSQGFNPTMKLSFGPPLPLGYTSEAEIVDIQLETTLSQYMIDNLELALPDGITIFEAAVVLGKAKSVSSQLNRTVYTIPAEALPDPHRIDAEIQRIMASDALVVARKGKEKATEVDIRPALFDIALSDDRLSMTLGIGDGGYARPSEVLALWYDEPTVAYLGIKTHRLDMYRINDTGARISAMEL